MKEKYTQLPPLPVDTPIESVEIIWLYACMSDKKRKMLYEFIKENVNDDIESDNKDTWIHELQAMETELDPDITEFAEIMKKLVKALIVQACEMAGYIYQHYCVEKEQLEYIAEKLQAPIGTVQLIAQYFIKNG